MADTVRTRSALLSLLADNSVGNISPQDQRDVLVSQFGVYGLIYASNGSTPQSSIATSFVLLTNWTADGPNAGLTPTFTSGKLTVGTNGAGVYLALAQVSFEGAINATYQFNLHVGAVDSGLGTNRKTATQDVGSASVAGLLTLADADEVTVYVKSDQGGGVALTLADAQLLLLRIA